MVYDIYLLIFDEFGFEGVLVFFVGCSVVLCMFEVMDIG